MAESDRVSETGLIHKRLDMGREERPILAGQHYFVLRIDAYEVNRGGWFRTNFPCLRFRADFTNGTGRMGTSERIIAPEFIAAIDRKNTDRVIQERSYPLGPIPYHGALDLEFGLFAAKADSGLDNVVKVLDQLSAFSAIPFAAVAGPYAQVLRETFDTISGGTDGFNLQVGVKNSFKGEFSEGTHVVARLPERRYNPADIGFDEARGCLVKGKRRSPIRGVPYAVYTIERVERRDDWMNIPDLKDAWEELRNLIRQEGNAASILAGLKRFERCCLTSFDLTQAHAEEITDALRARFSGLLDMRTVAMPQTVGASHPMFRLEDISDGESLTGFESLAGQALGRLFRDPGDLGKLILKGAGRAMDSARSAGEEIADRMRQRGAPDELPPPMDDGLATPPILDAPDEMPAPLSSADVSEPDPAPIPEPAPTPAPIIVEPPAPAHPPLFERVMEFVHKWEGGKVHHPNDPGGRTNMGVTQRVFDQWRDDRGQPHMDVFEISLAEASEIYRAKYWSKIKGDELPERIALAAMDFGVNSGPNRAVRYLQGLVGVVDDGVIGPNTLAAVARADAHALFRSYCDARERFYEQIIANNPNLAVFRNGWMNRLNDLRRVGESGGFESALSDWYARIGLVPATDDPIASLPDLGDGDVLPPLSAAEASLWKPPAPVTEADITALTELERDPERVDAHGALLSLTAALSQQAENRATLVEKLLEGLRKSRQFDRLHLAACEFVDRGVGMPFTQRMKAQALVELGRLEDALVVLRTAALAYPGDAAEISEMTGLEGRAFKQRFVAAAKEGQIDSAALEAAISAYQRGWENSKQTSHWHGVNLLALLHRADREGLSFLPEIPRPVLAQEVIAAAKADSEDIWAPASAAEAALALDDTATARNHVQSYVENPPDEFALASLHRQLRDVWALNKPGSDPVRQEIFDRVTLALMMTDGGKLDFEPGEIADLQARLKALDPDEDDDAMFESLTQEEIQIQPEPTETGGFESLQGGFQRSVAWVLRLGALFQCVGRIERAGPFPQPCGTGFVVRADLLNPAWAHHKRVLLTNEHVCSNLENPTSSAIRPEQAQVRFTELDAQRTYPLGEVLWCSPSSKHDVIITTLPDYPEGLRHLEYFCDPAPEAKENIFPGYRQPKVTVIGYPQGSDRPKLGIENLELLPLSKKRGAKRPEKPGDPEYLIYKSPTEPGNSGSPVFTWDTLETAAIHHWGKDSVGFNQGISLSSIIQAIAADPAVSKAPDTSSLPSFLQNDPVGQS
ncbi:MAG: trypsin-like peptidase domain-containing protein [Hyphomonadaceae bacterium]|nr:trypsin-like peptidase domain-containing protein [Hyphomonadaceae bacterium]